MNGESGGTGETPTTEATLQQKKVRALRTEYFFKNCRIGRNLARSVRGGLRVQGSSDSSGNGAMK